MATKKKPAATGTPNGVSNGQGGAVLLPSAVLAASPLLSSAALRSPLDELSLLQQIEAYRVLDEVEKKAKKRKEAIRDKLLAATEKSGTVTDKGGQELLVGGNRVLREKREATQPDDEGVVALMNAATIPLVEAFDEVKTFKLNPSKLEFLVKTGRIKAADVSKLHKVSWALRVQASKELNEALEALGL